MNSSKYSPREKIAIGTEVNDILDSIHKYVEWTIVEVNSTEDFERGWASGVRDVINIIEEWSKRYLD